ncbi:farnesyl diphosphate synthase [Lactarius quietus]|nr:farnesyl diphosphate synthase [Lactarius quietus]
MATIVSSPTLFQSSAFNNERAAVRKRFEDLYTVVRDDILEIFRRHNLPDEVIEHCLRSMEYNVPGGKLNRGLSVVDSVTIFKGRELTEEEYFKAAILGWIVEWIQAYSLVADDIVDSSITRRGQLCWYRVDGVGLNAINDVFVMEAAIFQLIRKHFHTEPFYVDINDLVHEILYRTEMGQLIDLLTAQKNVDLSKFSLARHSTTVLYKTSLFSLYFPVAVAMLFCGFPWAVEKRNESDPDYYKIALDILIPIGEYFQIQDDYLDYAGTPKQIGKIGTDIVDNKCSWCINTALARANPSQRAILDANYGREDSEAEARVKEIFREVGVDAVYAEYETESYARINELIDAAPEAQSPNGDAVLRRTVFRSLLAKIYKRTK